MSHAHTLFIFGSFKENSKHSVWSQLSLHTCQNRSNISCVCVCVLTSHSLPLPPTCSWNLAISGKWTKSLMAQVAVFQSSLVFFHQNNASGKCKGWKWKDKARNRIFKKDEFNKLLMLKYRSLVTASSRDTSPFLSYRFCYVFHAITFSFLLCIIRETSPYCHSLLSNYHLTVWQIRSEQPGTDKYCNTLANNKTEQMLSIKKIKSSLCSVTDPMIQCQWPLNKMGQMLLRICGSYTSYITSDG